MGLRGRHLPRPALAPCSVTLPQPADTTAGRGRPLLQLPPPRRGCPCSGSVALAVPQSPRPAPPWSRSGHFFPCCGRIWPPPVRSGHGRLDQAVPWPNLVEGRPGPACSSRIWPTATRSGPDTKKKRKLGCRLPAANVLPPAMGPLVAGPNMPSSGGAGRLGRGGAGR